MYTNRYYLTMKIPARINTPYSFSELEKIEALRIEHNELFASMSDRNTNNRKYISKIHTYDNGILEFHIETEKPLGNPTRYGNALRFFSTLVHESGLDLYIKHHKFMRAA